MPPLRGHSSLPNVCRKRTSSSFCSPTEAQSTLSKIYNDDWMKENGFLAPERVTLRFVLEAKSAKLPQLITVDASSTVRTALDLMTGKNISQLPVFDNKKYIGSVSEGNLLTILLKDSSKFDADVRTVMEPPFPEVHMNEEIGRAVEYFAKKEPAVLVRGDVDLIGIVTRFDVLGVPFQVDRLCNGKNQRSISLMNW